MINGRLQMKNGGKFTPFKGKNLLLCLIVLEKLHIDICVCIARVIATRIKTQCLVPCLRSFCCEVSLSNEELYTMKGLSASIAALLLYLPYRLSRVSYQFQYWQ